MSTADRLPLWNESQTDVLPEFQLTYGHVLFSGTISPDRLVQVVAHELDSRVVTEQTFVPAKIPRSPIHGGFVLHDAGQFHLIVAVASNYVAVFGPHRLFFQNQHWIRCNSRIKGLMAVVCRDDLETMLYRVFDSGRYVMLVVNSRGNIQLPPQEPISVYVDGKRVHEEKMADEPHSDRAKDLVRHDMSLKTEPNLTVAGSTGEEVHNIQHFILERSKGRLKGLFGKLALRPRMRDQ